MPGMSGQQGIADITARGGGVWKPPKPAAPMAPAAAPAAAPAWTPPPAAPAYGGPSIGAIPTWGGPAQAAAAAAPAPQQQRWGGWHGNEPFDWGGPGGAGWTPPAASTGTTGTTTTAPMDQTARLAAMTQRYAQMNPNSSLVGGAGWTPSMGDATRQQMRAGMWGGGMGGGGNRWMTGLGSGLLGG